MIRFGSITVSAIGSHYDAYVSITHTFCYKIVFSASDVAAQMSSREKINMFDSRSRAVLPPRSLTFCKRGGGDFESSMLDRYRHQHKKSITSISTESTKRF